MAAWLGLVVLFVTFGVAYSFGVFLPALADEFNIGPGSASFFFSLTSLLFFGLGIVTGPLSDRLGAKLFIATGGIFIAAGLWFTASAVSLVEAYLCYGAGIGVGVSCIFVPVVAAVSQHFEKRRSLALGITVSGIGLGTLVVAPVSGSLIESLGWRETYRIYAVVSAVVLILSGLLFPAPARAAAPARSEADHAGAISPGGRYPRFYLATILVNLAMYVPFTHLPVAAQASGIPAEQSAQVLGLLGLTSVASRMLIGAMGARFDEWLLYRLCIACVAVSFVLWSLAGSFGIYLLYAIVGGFGYGGYIALTPAVIAHEFAAARPGYLMGLTYTAVAIGASVGPVTAGILSQWLGGYQAPLLMLAVVTALGLIPLNVFPRKRTWPVSTDGTVSQRSWTQHSRTSKARPARACRWSDHRCLSAQNGPPYTRTAAGDCMDTQIERDPGMMDTLSTIGNTPMIELTRLFADPSVRVLAKLEFMNPSGSIKDRIVRHIVEDAEQRGALRPGGTIVEHTSGNTGAAAGMIGALRGYKVVLTMPEKVSHEKQCALRAYGAEVITCPNDAGPEDPIHYVQRARAIAEETPGSFMLNQYDNAKNVEAHYQTTGPEIWRQCNGEIDYFVASGSTGGTISGAGGYLKSRNPNMKLVFPDPVGSVYFGYFNNHQVNENDIDMYQVEGIGEDHLAGCMNFSLIDLMYRFRDEDAFNSARELALVEGLLCGGSSGANIWGCQQLIRGLKKPATIVTVLPDSGLKYLSKFYDDAWLDEACPQTIRVA